MPLTNFCKKCKREVPAGEQCPHCLGRLAKTGERVSFGLVRVPVQDWFSWNQALRVALPTLGLVAAATLAIEGAISGERGIQALFLQGFLGTLLGLMGLMLLVMLALLALQGREFVQVTLDKEGVHAHVYLRDPSTVRLYARFLTWAAVEAMQRKAQGMEGYVLVRRTDLPWSEIQRVRFWRENFQILLFRPSWWQALAVSCPARDYQEAEALLRKKLGKKVKISG